MNCRLLTTAVVMLLVATVLHSQNAAPGRLRAGAHKVAGAAFYIQPIDFRLSMLRRN
jgi:hypothetical protein